MTRATTSGNRRRSRALRQSLAPLTLVLCVALAWPAESLARALIRFIHALPGVGRITVAVGRGGRSEQLGAVAFAQATGWHSLRSGRFRWSIDTHGKPLAGGTATVGGGAYDVVLLSPRPPSVMLAIYRARGGVRGASLLRVIHAAPELGAPALRLDRMLVTASLRFEQATAYHRLTPGVHSLAALPNVASATPLVAIPRLRLLGGASYSAILVGSRGQRLRWVTVTDRGAPLTRPARRPAPASARMAIVEPGDSLWTIAARHLGPGAGSPAIEAEVQAIWSLNAARLGTGDPNLIFPGQIVLFPLAATT